MYLNLYIIITCNAMQKLLSEDLGMKKKVPIWKKDIWPSNSPDLNPMDYSIWSILERKVCSTRYNSLESLKEALVKE